MKHDYTIEILLPSEFSSSYWNQKRLVKWLTTTVQSIIVEQQVRAKKIFLSAMKNTPAIYMS